MIPASVTPLANHLWQSTLFAAVAGALTFTLRKHSAQARYAVWLAASVKFLVPFSVLVEAGSHLGWNPLAHTAPQAGFSQVMSQMTEPFIPVAALPRAPVASGAANPLPTILLALWAAGVVVVAFNWWRRWRHLRAAARAARPLPVERGIRVMSTAALFEPGVFGIRQPVLLLPEGIFERLTPAELDAILEHEYCHVRRRDNLAAALHLLVETLFWFHPLVWWIERQLVRERERACDEEVLRRGKDPEIYAEGILKVCRFYVESPLVCAAGVTGANLTKRIEEIMTHRIAPKLDLGRKLLLAAAGLAAVATPLIVGMAEAPATQAQEQPAARLAFEAASVKENKAGDPRSSRLSFLPGGRLFLRDLPLISIVSVAYDLPVFNPSERLTGGPDWIRKTNYDIEATAPSGAIPEGASDRVRSDRIRQMLQTLLAERFKMVVRPEMKELPVYAVTVAKGGPKMPKAAVEEKDCAVNATNPNDPAACHMFSGGQGQGMHGRAVTLTDLVSGVSGFTDRPVLDRTGLQGLYNIQTEGWVPMRPRPPRPPGQEATAEDLAFADPARPTLFQIFDRLGLKLEPTKAPVETFAIERIERPSEN